MGTSAANAFIRSALDATLLDDFEAVDLVDDDEKGEIHWRHF